VRDSNMGRSAKNSPELYGPPILRGLCDTSPMTIVLIAIALYLLAAGLVVRNVSGDGATRRNGWLAAATLAVVMHAGFHLSTWREAGGADLHFFAALSLVGLGMAGLTTLYGARGRMATLGVVVFP